MYFVYGVSRPSLLIKSTDTILYHYLLNSSSYAYYVMWCNNSNIALDFMSTHKSYGFTTAALVIMCM